MMNANERAMSRITTNGRVFLFLLIFTCYAQGQTFSSVESLFSDARAHRVGDIITIHIIEYSKGSNTASSRTKKDSDVGLNSDGSGSLGFFPIGGFGVKNNVNFQGEGESSRKGSLQGKMTAKITSIDANGNFVIKGNREIIVNKERQTMELDGTVRPEDISYENIVLSYDIANAKISYSGSGQATGSQKPGWLTRIFNWLF
ncbi:MAG: flagellar basal body L-ring protein FlgH [Calditrichaeota bacterium]|nr:MAG: flagellar basal body L-ring protein FlgH [Calditrichota bacterium]